jgi:dihydropteroate synthase
MGVLNVTPDSFSDGGNYLDRDRAIGHGLDLVAAGADVVDVGGESTRPGADPVSEDEELRRVVPVVAELSQKVRVSVDTTKKAVALASIEAGATMVNDVSASLWEVAAEAGAGWVAMHMQGVPRSMQADPRYRDVVAEVHGFLLDRAATGVTEIWLDPGIGFGKTKEHNLTLLRHLPDLVAGGFPVLVGTSRKSFLGKIAPLRDGSEAPVGERFEASLATATWAMLAGASMVRVHDVGPTVQAATLVGSARLESGPILNNGPSGDGNGYEGAGSVIRGSFTRRGGEVERRASG